MNLSNLASAGRAAIRENAITIPRLGENGNSQLLSPLEFDLQLLSSERCVSRKCDCLSSSEREKLKELFIKHKHPRFEKEFAVSRHQPFGKTSDYVKSIENADSTKMAKQIKLVGMLLQTKVYLFWNKESLC